MRRKLKTVLICAAAALFVAAAVLTRSAWRGLSLVLENADTGELYAEYLVAADDIFSVEFIHSVNQSPVRDFYEIRGDREIYVVATRYFAFGAGVQTELRGGEALEYGDDGSMLVKNINIHIPSLIYVVGTISDHTLYIGGDEISLRELCGRNSSVRFTVKWRSILC